MAGRPWQLQAPARRASADRVLESTGQPSGAKCCRCRHGNPLGVSEGQFEGACDQKVIDCGVEEELDILEFLLEVGLGALGLTDQIVEQFVGFEKMSFDLLVGSAIDTDGRHGGIEVLGGSMALMDG